ncbi:hypothetical protein BH11BAC2_BH11BAC2_10560 [soil metagenome]
MNLSVRQILKSNAIFADTAEDDLTFLEERIRPIIYKTGAEIIRKGEFGDTMYIIASGSVKIHDGEHSVASLREGDFFGELSLLDKFPRSLSVSALEESHLLEISRELIFNIYEHNPSVFQKILTELIRRLRKLNDSTIQQMKLREEELQSLVDERTKDLLERNRQLAETLEQLSTAQEQLIHSEKMASLGRLTAGIAHEIQNPLNFVNNFSAVSGELLDELQESNDVEERIELGDMLKDNLSRINQHGKRAEEIVRSMLQHSRTNTTDYQDADLNHVVRDSVSLFKGGHKPDDVFNKIIIRFIANPEIIMINAVAQDLQRVFINLMNNAADALIEKFQVKSDFLPELLIKTRKEGIWAITEIRDNGPGIPKEIQEKIFEPFFTTKTSGKGTGLGLSISFEIITKAHKGSISIDSQLGEGTTFTIRLPLLLEKI